MAKHKRKSLDDLKREYEDLLPRAEAFARELTHQLDIVGEGSGARLAFPVQSRVKSWESIADKLKRLPNLSVAHITDLQDVIGLRMIPIFRRDAVELCARIDSALKVVDQYDTQSRLKHDQFGYASRHLIVEVPREWLQVPSLREFAGMRAEVQVRTLAQHMWAEASHVLQYKREETVPPGVLRPIHRVSALLETVDLEFERVLDEREAYRAEIKGVVEDQLLNVDLLEQVLDQVLPTENRDKEEDFADLLLDLQHFEVTTTDKLRSLIATQRAAVAEEESVHVARDRDSLAREGPDSVEDAERARRGVFFTYTGLAGR